MRYPLSPPTDRPSAVRLSPLSVQGQHQEAPQALPPRVAGEGAEPYLTEWFGPPRPRVPLLYATTKGLRYERFEIGSVKGPTWPAGVYRVTVRLFARGGKDVMEEVLFVWPGSRRQLTMDPWPNITD